VSETEQKVVIVTAARRGSAPAWWTGTGSEAGGRGEFSQHQAVEGPDILTVEGDISEQATADQIISQAIDRFGRVDTLVNNAGVFVSKPFIDYTAEDYALVTGVNSPDSSG